PPLPGTATVAPPPGAPDPAGEALPWRSWPSSEQSSGNLRRRTQAAEETEMSFRWMGLALTLSLALAGLATAPIDAQDKPQPIELKFSSWVGVGHGHHTALLFPSSTLIDATTSPR